jgi:hypothetical protein
MAAAPYGSSLILPISYAYISMMGSEGLTEVPQNLPRASAAALQRIGGLLSEDAKHLSEHVDLPARVVGVFCVHFICYVLGSWHAAP